VRTLNRQNEPRRHLWCQDGNGTYESLCFQPIGLYGSLRGVTRVSIGCTVSVMALLALAACGSHPVHSANNASVVSPAASGSGSPTPSNSASIATATRVVPVTVQSPSAMRAAGNYGPTSAILDPSTCAITKTTATVTGTYEGGFAPNIYSRYGDRIDLYVFTAPQPGYPRGIQLAQPFTDHSPAIGGSGRWTVRVPLLVTGFGHPARCMVAAQPTQDWQGAP
jgi:hypothetical protein